MSLDKAIEHGKEHRKPYYKKAKRNSMTCRSHGGCPFCQRSRMHKHLKRIAIAEDTKLELEKDLDGTISCPLQDRVCE